MGAVALRPQRQRERAAGTQAIATSRAQNDSGLFEVNFRDERYLPFEYAGAVSRWMITMPPACNAFAFDTITDVILKLSYTARDGGDLLCQQAFAAAQLPPATQQNSATTLVPPPQGNLHRLFSARHEFPTGWYGLLHPLAATPGQMQLTLTMDRFPFQYRARTIQTADVEIFVVVRPGTTPPSPPTLYLTSQAPPPGGTPPTPPPLNPADQVTLDNSTPFGPNVLHGRKSTTSKAAVPQIWWLSLDPSSVSNLADQVQDIFVMFSYSVS